MTTLDHMLERNRAFASEQASKKSPMPLLPAALPNVKAIVIGCADMRVDPALVLGVELGEAVVMRNIGGRVTPGLIEQIGLLGRIGEIAHAIPGGGGAFNIVVMHHTDCGITRLNGNPEMLAKYFEIEEADVHLKAVMDPEASVAVDVAELMKLSALPVDWLVSGIVYDLHTGNAKLVVPPKPIGG